VSLAIRLCSECQGTHGKEDVKFLNVEEDAYGNDLLTYICPITKKQAQSNIYLGRI
jgi:hypothetical protein